MDRTSRAPMDCLDVHLLSSSSFHTFLYFVVLEFIRLSLFSFSAAPFSSRLGATTVSLIIIPELLPFSSFSLARSVLHVPNANLMACSIVVSFHFVSFSSSNIIGFGVWLDRATIQFRFYQPNSGYTWSFCVFGPVLSSPAHAPSYLAMPQI
jgi:hypothetical protein